LCLLRLRLKVELLLKSPDTIWCLQAHCQSPLLVSFRSISEVRGLPSITFPRLRRYYAPLRLPPRSTPSVLLRVATPLPGRVSHVAYNTFPTCHPQYPGGSEQVLLSVASLFCGGLPRILGGSASTTVLSRPAQGSLTLRPVGLQPTYSGLLSPKLQQEGLPVRLSG